MQRPVAAAGPQAAQRVSVAGAAACTRRPARKCVAANGPAQLTGLECPFPKRCFQPCHQVCFFSNGTAVPVTSQECDNSLNAKCQHRRVGCSESNKWNRGKAGRVQRCADHQRSRQRCYHVLPAPGQAGALLSRRVGGGPRPGRAHVLWMKSETSGVNTLVSGAQEAWKQQTDVEL